MISPRPISPIPMISNVRFWFFFGVRLRLDVRRGFLRDVFAKGIGVLSVLASDPWCRTQQLDIIAQSAASGQTLEAETKGRIIARTRKKINEEN